MLSQRSSNENKSKPNAQCRVSRRHIVTALGGTMVSLSGCLGLGGLLGSKQTITKTTFQPFQLAVSLREKASVNRVTLIAPNGTTVSRKSVSAGQTTVELPLVAVRNDYTPLSPGKYTIAVGNNGETVAEKQIELTSSWTVADAQTKDNRNLLITLKNTGDLPVKATYLGVTEGIPTPDDPPQKGAVGTPRRTNAPNRDELRQSIGSGNRATFSVYGGPLVFYKGTPKQSLPQWKRKAAKCRGLTHKATLVLTVAPTGKRTYSLPITYGGTPHRGLGSHTCAKVAIGNTSRI